MFPFCEIKYKRFRLSGSEKYLFLQIRFWALVSNIGSSDCWEWVGGHYRCGYGIFLINERSFGAHRLSWMFHNGPLEDGLYILHKCDNKPCVNPEHLFPGTAQYNSRDCVRKGRNWAASKKFCKNGHEFSSANTIIYFSNKTGRRIRVCRICKNESGRRDYHRKIGNNVVFPFYVRHLPTSTGGGD